MAGDSLPKTNGVEYRSIPNFPGYAVGDDGSVWGCRHKSGFVQWKKMRPAPSSELGHLFVGLRRDGRYFYRQVHRLVLEAFIGPCPPDMECCHGPNRDPRDNRLANLRWDTHESNMRERAKHGTQNTGSQHGMAKLNEEKVAEIRRTYASGGTSQLQLADRYSVSPMCISNVLRGRTWSHVEVNL